MSIKNTHPRLVEKISRQLPSGFRIDDLRSSSKDKTVVRIRDTKGNILDKAMDKVHLEDLFKTKTPAVYAEEGNLVLNKVKELLTKLKLDLVSGIDYHTGNNTRVGFRGRDSYTINILAQEDSTVCKGSIELLIISQTDLPKDITLTLSMSIAQAKLVTMGKVWSLHGNKRIFSGDRLTKGFVDLVFTALPNRLKTKITQEQLLEGKVTDYLHDGISDVMFLTIGKESFPIRFKSIEGDLPNL